MLVINLKENVNSFTVSQMMGELNSAIKQGRNIVLPYWAEAIKVDNHDTVYKIYNDPIGGVLDKMENEEWEK